MANLPPITQEELFNRYDKLIKPEDRDKFNKLSIEGMIDLFMFEYEREYKTENT